MARVWTVAVVMVALASAARAAPKAIANAAGQLPAKSFEVAMGRPQSGQYFRARVDVAPVIEVVRDVVYVDLGGKQITSQVLASEGPCTNCVAITFRAFKADWGEYPEQRWRQARIVFDRETVVVRARSYRAEAAIPAGASALRRIEIDLGDETVKRTLVWEVGAAAGERSIAPWLIGAAVLALIAGTVAAKKLRRGALEIRLVDRDGRPIAGAAYRIELPPGTTPPVVTGVLDANGTARVAKVAAGSCKVSFPELDRDWGPV